MPAARFFETQNQPDASDGVAKKRRRSLYSFGMPDDAPVLLAGVQQDGCFSVVTTQPNASVVPVHDRMPLVLSWHEAWRWLGDGFASLADRGAIVLESRFEQQSEPRSSALADGQMSLILSFRHRRSVSETRKGRQGVLFVHLVCAAYRSVSPS